MLKTAVFAAIPIANIPIAIKVKDGLFSIHLMLETSAVQFSDEIFEFVPLFQADDVQDWEGPSQQGHPEWDPLRGKTGAASRCPSQAQPPERRNRPGVEWRVFVCRLQRSELIGC